MPKSARGKNKFVSRDGFHGRGGLNGVHLRDGGVGLAGGAVGGDLAVGAQYGSLLHRCSKKGKRVS